MITVACEQSLFWGLAWVSREQRSRERASALSWLRGFAACLRVPPLAREAPKESLLAVYDNRDLQIGVRLQDSVRVQLFKSCSHASDDNESQEPITLVTPILFLEPPSLLLVSNREHSTATVLGT